MQRKHYEDSIAALKINQSPVVNPVADSVAKIVPQKDTSGFNKALNGSEQLTTVENELMKIVFSNKGAQPKAVT